MISDRNKVNNKKRVNFDPLFLGSNLKLKSEKNIMFFPNIREPKGNVAKKNIR